MYNNPQNDYLKLYIECTLVHVHVQILGVDFKDRAIRLGKKDIVVEIWDTAGSEAFDTVTTPIYDRMEGIIVMFDIANINTFKNLDRWIHKIKVVEEEYLVMDECF